MVLMRQRLLACALCVAGCSAARADSGKPSAIDPKADKLLHKMSDELAKAKRMQFDADHVLEAVTTDGEVLQFVARSRVAIQRPNKARSDRIGRIADATLYYDGKQISIVGKRTGLYASKPAPATLDGALDFARDELDLDAPAADLLYDDVYSGLMQDVVSASYLGTEPIGDRVCHHLAYRGKDTDWQIWIDDGKRALPCRYVITSKNVKGTPTFEVAFSNWEINPQLPENYFTFKPPRGGTEIEFMPRSALTSAQNTDEKKDTKDTENKDTKGTENQDTKGTTKESKR